MAAQGSHMKGIQVVVGILGNFQVVVHLDNTLEVVACYIHLVEEVGCTHMVGTLEGEGHHTLDKGLEEELHNMAAGVVELVEVVHLTLGAVGVGCLTAP